MNEEREIIIRKVKEMSDTIDKIEKSPYGISISLLIQLFQKNNELKKLLK